jgi:hypothetical protein
MAPGTIRDQAEAFLSWSARAGLPRDKAWCTWVESKSFAPADAEAIDREVRALRVRRAAESYMERQRA